MIGLLPLVERAGAKTTKRIRDPLRSRLKTQEGKRNKLTIQQKSSETSTGFPEFQYAADGRIRLTMKDLLAWIRINLIKERPEMFMKGDSVRPGVLALVNDCDWELTGQLNATLEEKDVVVFISTLHGGLHLYHCCIYSS
ncbi:uncharacterized protein LOC126794079 [Argentina anserina]|uniref:uncharacterized protein LOC126794079 n=1 Tax=Argentina anserina TaxID=57926 RepID=UPI0021764F77|nr:uncharacterized protein LOC126794079 [Potentilla anserina]